MINPSLIQGKNVLLRADLDVPLSSGRVENDYRLKALVPTIQMCLNYASRTCIIGHLGRPQSKDAKFSLKPVVETLKRLIDQDISFIDSGFSLGERWKGENPLMVLENIRFDNREENLSDQFAHELADGADLYIYEAFAHYRSSTSLNKIPETLPTATGLRFDLEVSTLGRILVNPEKPTLLIASGAKPDKLEIIKNISPRFDRVLLGGKFAQPEHLTADGLDLNPEAISLFQGAISEAGTVVLNGPLGYYEDHVHDKATRAILNTLKDSHAFTILGGGDTLASIPLLGFKYEDFNFVSTGGGAMLEFLATNTHPLLEVLKKPDN